MRKRNGDWEKCVEDWLKGIVSDGKDEESRDLNREEKLGVWLLVGWSRWSGGSCWLKPSPFCGFEETELIGKKELDDDDGENEFEEIVS